MPASQIAALINTLPSFPVSVQRVIQEINSPRSSAESVAVALELDPPLVACVLRVANSGFYGRTKVSSPQAAVTRVGLQEVRGLATSAALRDILDTGGAEEIERLYVLALASALVVSRIARRSSVVDTTNASSAFFTAALLHDIGLFALFSFSPGSARRSIEQARTQKVPLSDVERTIVGFPHTELGATLLQRWHLSDVEIEACRWHHAPGSAPQLRQTPAALIHIADYLVLDLVGDVQFTVLAPALLPEALAALRLTAEDVDRLRVEVTPCVEHATSVAGELRPATKRAR